MKQISQTKVADLVKKLRESGQLTYEQLSAKTEISAQLLMKIENCKYIPSISQLEKLASVFGVQIHDLYEESEPMVYTAFRSSSMSQEEKEGVDHMFDMMMVSKQQILLRKAMKK